MDHGAVRSGWCGSLLFRLAIAACSALGFTTLQAEPFAKMGPQQVQPKPTVFMLRAVNPTNYADGGGLLGIPMQSGSDSSLRSTSGKALRQIQQVMPEFDFVQEVQTAFSCGAPAALCSSFEVLTLDEGESLDDGLKELLQARSWQEVRVLSLSFEIKRQRVFTQMTLEDGTLDEKGKLQFAQQTRAAHLGVIAKRRRSREERATKPEPKLGLLADGWKEGTPTQLEVAVRAAIKELPSLLQLALSAAANNDYKVFGPYEDTLPLWKDLRPEGETCPDFVTCRMKVSAVTSDRVWWWTFAASRGALTGSQEDIKKYGLGIMELQSWPMQLPTEVR